MTSQSRALRVLITVAVALAAVGLIAGGAAAATDTLAGDDTDVIEDFNASDDDHVEYSLASDAANFSEDGTDTVYLNMTVNDEHVEVSNGSIDDTASSYTFNLSHDEMGTIPGDAGENTTITVNAWGEDSTTNTVNTTVDTFDATLMYEDGYAVVYIGDTATAGDVDGVTINANEADGILATFGLAKDTYAVEADNVGLGNTSAGTTIHVVAANQSSVDAFTDAEDKRLGSYESEDYIGSHLVQLEGHTHAVFFEDAPVDDLASDYTYATVGERNGHDAYTIHVDEDYDGESSIDVATTANSGPTFDFLVKRDAFGGTLGALGAALAFVGSIARREV